MTVLPRIAFACLLPLLLTGCLLMPGKFTSGFDIRADRHFSFHYKGEVVASDPSQGLSDFPSPPSGDTADAERQARDKADHKADKAKERESRNRALAAALSKEAGYRSVVYKGNGRFEVDYAIDGLLTTGFLFPFNSDGEVLVPFIAAEIRKDGTVRIKAPAFGKTGGHPSAVAGMPMMGEPENPAEGSFTITTTAEIVMHNQEEGTTASPGGTSVTWVIGPLKKDPPTAVLRFRP